MKAWVIYNYWKDGVIRHIDVAPVPGERKWRSAMINEKLVVLKEKEWFETEKEALKQALENTQHSIAFTETRLLGLRGIKRRLETQLREKWAD